MESLTIVLVGDGEALKGAPTQTKYWVGRIVYPQVPLGTFKEHYNQSTLYQPTTLPYRVERAPVTAPATPVAR